MARIEWSALSGDEVEAVISNFLYNEYRRAARVRPAQGDYGIDVMIPSDREGEVFDIYQVKKFAQNLNSSQKGQIKNSFKRLMVGLTRKGIPVGDWYLVMPLDLTIDGIMEWLNDMPNEAIAEMASDRDLALTEQEVEKIWEWRLAPGRIIETKGLNACEAWASKYWFVADYYLHGGSERIRTAVADVAKILTRDMTLIEADSPRPSTSILEPGEIEDHFLRLQRTLDGDPHFRYGVSFDPIRPEIVDEEDLVAVSQRMAPDGSCLTFRIYKRHDESLNQRPIPIKMNFIFEGDSQARSAYEEWRKYGKPLSIPARVEADLPGGLGGGVTAGTVFISAADDGRKYESRYRVRTPEGEVTEPVRFLMRSTSGVDGSGIWVHGADTSGLLTTEGVIDRTTSTGNIKFRIGNLQGLNPVKVLGAVEFASQTSHPNILQIAGQYGPFHDFHSFSEPEALLPAWVARYIRALATLQNFTSEEIHIPDLNSLESDDVHGVLRAESLVEGRTLVGTWVEFVFQVNSGITIDQQAHYQLAKIQPLKVNVGSQVIIIGAVQAEMLSVRLSQREGSTTIAAPYLNNTVHYKFSPHQQIPIDNQNPLLMRVLPAVE